MNIDQKTLERFQFLRLVCLSIGTAIFLFAFLEESFLFEWKVALVFAFFWLETGLLYLAKSKFSKHKVLLGEFFVDFVLVTWLILLTGGRESPFIFLYPLLIFVGSLHFGPRKADFLVLFCLLAYTYIYWQNLRPQAFTPDHLLGFFVPLGAMGVSALLALRLAQEVVQSKKKAAETKAALFRVEELHRHIMRSLASGLIITDLSGKIVSANQRAHEILGEGLEGKKLKELFPQLNLQESQKRCEIVLENGEKKYLGYNLFPLRDEEERIFGYGFLFQDITQIKEQEERLRQTEHLAALGTMATGLVHEIKNPLASIYGAVELLKERRLILSEGTRLVNILERESRRLDKLVCDFLLFARPTKGEAKEVSLNVILQELRDELALRPRALEFEIHVPSGPKLLVDPGRLKQVLLNLFLNAIEAAPPDFSLKIQVFYLDHPQGAILEVRDNAGGIPEDILPHIFEPFFTTKTEGTGLGLSVVYGLVQSWGGRIEVKSHSKGTSFLLFFPSQMVICPAKAA